MLVKLIRNKNLVTLLLQDRERQDSAETLQQQFTSARCGLLAAMIRILLALLETCFCHYQDTYIFNRTCKPYPRSQSLILPHALAYLLLTINFSAPSTPIKTNINRIAVIPTFRAPPYRPQSRPFMSRYVCFMSHKVLLRCVPFCVVMCL